MYKLKELLYFTLSGFFDNFMYNLMYIVLKKSFNICEYYIISSFHDGHYLPWGFYMEHFSNVDIVI